MMIREECVIRRKSSFYAYVSDLVRDMDANCVRRVVLGMKEPTSSFSLIHSSYYISTKVGSNPDGFRVCLTLAIRFHVPIQLILLHRLGLGLGLG